jgi:molecular chaperone GrpE
VSKEKNTDSTAALHQKLNENKTDEMELLEHPSYIELQNKLTEAEEKAAQNWDRCLRLQAENENTLRRVERDVANAHKYGLEKLVNELLPVIDNLERSLHASNNAEDPVLQGVDMTLKMFNSALEKFGVIAIDPENQPFNPEWHQAVSTQPDDSVKPGTVLKVLQKGYQLNGRLVRPALVIVSKA